MSSLIKLSSDPPNVFVIPHVRKDLAIVRRKAINISLLIHLSFCHLNNDEYLGTYKEAGTYNEVGAFRSVVENGSLGAYPGDYSNGVILCTIMLLCWSVWYS